jgi:anaerobic selenocysteine-containing dehydrogenase
LVAPPEGLFSEAELHARIAEAMGLMPKPAVDALSQAWDAGRDVFSEKFFELLASEPGFLAMAPVALYRAIGPKLPPGREEGAALWAIAQIAAQQIRPAIQRAGIGTKPGVNLGDALFDRIIESDRGFVFAIDDWDESLGKIGLPGGRIDMAVEELFGELDALATEERMPFDPDFPMVLSAGERRSFTANTILRNPAWRRKGAEGALTLSPADAERLGLDPGARARLTTRRGAAEVVVEISDRMQAGHCSLPNGTGLVHPGADDRLGGISPNELTSSADCDPIAATPWHKSTAARVEAL